MDDLILSAHHLIDLLADNQFQAATALFDNTMQSALPAEKLASTWASLTSQLGRLQQQGDAKTEQAGQHQVVLIACHFAKATMTAKVAFNSEQQIAGLFITPASAATDYAPPPYVTPGAFREQELQVGAGEWVVPGTLTLPVGDSPFPAVVLVSGSGPNDRDETIGPNKPFKDLAWGLASRGVAVLRCDKRTRAYPEKALAMLSTFTMKEEYIEDALEALAQLLLMPQIDARRIFLLGHSQGGSVLPRIGKADPALAGFIIMAGGARKLEDTYLDQMTYIFSLDGGPTEEQQKQLEQIRAQVERVKHLRETPAAPADLPLGVPAAYWLDLQDDDPPAAAKSLAQPILILQGGRDYQVTGEDFQRWQNALTPRQDVTFKFYPTLNHLFLAGTGQITPAEYAAPGHVSQQVVEDIAGWIQEHYGSVQKG